VNESTKWAVIFDMDGTMVDNRAFHEKAWLELGRRRGLTVLTPEYYRARVHSRSNAEIVRTLMGADATPDLIREIGTAKEALYRELYAPFVREVPGLTALLTALRAQSVPCAVVSNSPRENVAFVLSALQLEPFFTTHLSVDDVVHGKPAPDLLTKAAAIMGVAVSRCVVLEDSVSGFVAAQRAGAPYLVITAGADHDTVPLYRDAARGVHRDFTTLDPETLRGCVASRDRWQ
jgi:HAD superfamily hydrolase (TIGR01509 family)